MGRAGKGFLAISIVTAIAFWASVPFRPFEASPVLKWFPVGMLALYVLCRGRSGREWTLALALLFHSIGDVVLDMDGGGLFLFAIGAFLLGHLFYIATFVPDVRANLRMTRGKRIFVAGIVLYSLVAFPVLLPRVETGMILPVILYTIAIGTMVVMSVLPGYRGKWITIGALLYIASDSLIAVNLFVVDVPASHYLTWPAYYAAQALIVAGVLREKSLPA